jgi:hypothetical protein
MAGALIIFSLTISALAANPPTISSFSPMSGPVGSMVVINGANFVPPLSITFAGNVQAAGSFTSTQITVTVPSGAETGTITVTTAGGSATTTTDFVVGGTAPAGGGTVLTATGLTNPPRIIITWPVSSTNYTLQVSTSLNPGSVWGAPTVAPFTNNGVMEYSNTITSQSQFFRLKYP